MGYAVETAIPYGNAGNVEIAENSDHTRIAFEAHPHGGPECLWFCFRIMSDGQADSSGRIKLAWSNFRNILGGNEPSQCAPVVRYDGQDWRRIGPGEAERLPDGRVNGIWMLDAPQGHVDVAFCFPYGMPEVEQLLQDTGGYYRADTIGLSQGGRRLVRLSNDYGSDSEKRPGIYIVARQHSSETPGSWVLDGFLRRMAELGDAAPLIWAVPLTNIDGVEQGDYGKDNFPYDLNRAWGNPQMRHETHVFARDIWRWKERCNPVLMLDFHAPGACETDGIYTFLTPCDKNAEQHEAMMKWAKIIEGGLAPEFLRGDYIRYANYASRWETAKSTDFAWNNGLCGLTFENPYSMIGDMILTRERYREAGGQMAQAVANAM